MNILESINNKIAEFRRLHKELTNVVVGKQEMEAVRNLAFIPAVKELENVIPLPNSVLEELRKSIAITFHQLKDVESHFEGFDLNNETDKNKFDKLEFGGESMEEYCIKNNYELPIKI